MENMMRENKKVVSRHGFLLKAAAFFLNNTNWLKLSFVFVFFLISIAYWVRSEVYYETSVMVGAPHALELVEINKANLLNSKLKNFTPDEVFALFSKSLASEQLKDIYNNSLYKESAGSSSGMGRINNSDFVKALSITAVGNPVAIYKVSIRAKNFEVSQDLAEKFLEIAADLTVKSIRNNFDTMIENHISNIELKMNELEQGAKAERVGKIIRLKEARAIAKSANIKRPMLSSHTQNKTIIKLGDDLMYLQGVDALNAQIEVLSKRKLDQDFITGYRDLELESKSFQALQNQKFRVPNVFTVEQSTTLQTAKLKGLPALLFFIGWGITLGWLLALGIRVFKQEK